MTISATRESLRDNEAGGRSALGHRTTTHFHHLDDGMLDRLFSKPPQRFGDSDSRELLAMSLGATLYVPASRDDLPETVMRRAAEGVSSMVMDLEDAVADHDVEKALVNAVAALDSLAKTDAAGMLIFVRIRDLDTIRQIEESITTGVFSLTGFVLPKFTAPDSGRFLQRIDAASVKLGKHLYAMPVLESAELVHRETRHAQLAGIADLLAEHRNRILAVRIGATDMCGTFAIRRDRDLTIYDVRVVADVIADIVNFLGRADGTGFTITGPVWEYFADHERMFRPTLRATPFAQHDAVRFREHLVSRDLDGLLREIVLDRANGIQGKTVIHPSHVAVVHAFSAVTHEEYQDAIDILEQEASGVQASAFRNKMNEMRPHRSWAEQTVLRGEVFGVTNSGIGFVDLLTALVDR